ncbi:MAG TPA: hypothetical protein VHA30_04975 [Patescibacteria group bacterium]|nr:hypothetical protein [Patescibacteria group bacterium]
MLETKQQKEYLVTILVLIIILGLVSFWHRPDFTATDTTDYQALQQQYNSRQQAYAQYLKDLGSTPEGQTALYQEILPPDQVQQAVEQQLDTAQAIVYPAKPQTPVRVVASSGRTAIIDFISASSPIADQVKAASDASAGDLFNDQGSSAQVDSLAADLAGALQQYGRLNVPQEAAEFQNQQLIVLEAYQDLAQTAQGYMADPGSSNPWPRMYKDYAIISQSAQKAQSAFGALNQKYNLLGDAGQSDAQGSLFVPAAHAQIGISLVTDIWQKAWVGVEEALAASVARFELQFLNMLANKIEQVYRITNFLYYTDALVGGQYVDDYLNKYVPDSLDRQMIKNFIPEVSCGSPQNYLQVFQAKADQYLGFDPQALNPADPDYYQKLSRVGNFLSSPQGWQLYYQDVAQQAQSAAQQAANNELSSNGNKSSRDVTGSIAVSAQTTVDTLRAALQAQLGLGQAGSAGYPTAANIASQITQTFLNNFVFQGTVLKEQKACIAVPQAQLVTPLPLYAAPANPTN